MIRSAGQGDLPRLVELERVCFPDEAWGPAALRGELERPEGLAIIDEGGRGYALGWSVAGEAELLRVGVPPQARGQGRGEALVRHLMRLATEGGAERIFLEVRLDNWAARGLYVRCGWREVGRRRRYYVDGCDAILYAAELVSPAA
jgi:ribosomal-protein-alanine N-acetyltransferase